MFSILSCRNVTVEGRDNLGVSELSTAGFVTNK